MKINTADQFESQLSSNSTDDDLSSSSEVYSATSIIRCGKDLRFSAWGLPIEFLKEITESLTLVNPAYGQALKHNRSVWNIPEYIEYYEKEEDLLILPRGFLKNLTKIFVKYNIQYEIRDKTRLLPKTIFKFKGRLHLYQREAVRKIIEHDSGVVEGPPGSGKTVLALMAICFREQPTLIIVHTKELLYQWKERIVMFLDLDPEEIGLIGDGHFQLGDRITVAIIKTLSQRVDEVAPYIGHVIVDECHRAPSPTFRSTLAEIDSKYMLGLSATPFRSDNQTKAIHFYLGDLLHRIDQDKLIQDEIIMEAELVVRNTSFDYPSELASENYPECISALINDQKRNKLIINDILEMAASERKGIILVLSERRAHCQYFHNDLRNNRIESRLLLGNISTPRRTEVIHELHRGCVRVLVATTSLLGEGFDLKALAALFIATPMKFRGRVKQSVGRILRTDEGKDTPVIYDYLDLCLILQASFESRIIAYEELGIVVDEIYKRGIMPL